jgi:hypothetical protein
VDDGSARIELRRRNAPSLWVVVDEADLDLVQAYRWHVMPARHTTYAVATVGSPRAMRTTIRVHRLIMDAPQDVEVDHIDHDGLNNRRSNLRLATGTQNLGNMRHRGGTTSRYKGVYWSARDRRWLATISVASKSIHLGSFVIEEEAARAYDAAAVQAFGEFAYLNFPDAPRSVA